MKKSIKKIIICVAIIVCIVEGSSLITNANTHTHTAECYNGATPHEHTNPCYAVGCTTCSGEGYRYSTSKAYGNVYFSTPVAYCTECGGSCTAPSRDSTAKKKYESCNYCSYQDFTQTFTVTADCGHGTITYVYRYYHACSYYSSSANVAHNYSTTGSLTFRSNCSKCQSSTTAKCGKTVGAYYNADGTAASVICDKWVTGITPKTGTQTIYQ